MLGPVKSGSSWWWTAAGKHPAARDYLRLGHLSPFTDGFADWVRNGYRNMNLKENKPISAFRSWRFWASGFGKGALACGVVRDSSDSMGRQYPFLIMGNGPMKGWEDRWNLLTHACEETWRRMESLSLNLPEGSEHLEKEIRHGIPPPVPEWSRHAARVESVGEADGSFEEWASYLERECSAISGRIDFLIELDHEPAGDPFALALPWTNFMKRHQERIPSSLFMGGTSEMAFLAVFHRPLMPSDFVRLWSVTRGGKPCGAIAAPSA